MLRTNRTRRRLGHMIVDGRAPVDLSGLVPELRLEMEPELRELDRLLSDDSLFAAVKADLSKRYPNSRTRGRHSTPVEVILRMLVVRRLYNWSYEATERNVSDSLVLRQFVRLYLEAAPDDTTLIRWAGLVGSDTLGQLNDRAEELAKTLTVTRGRRLRTDGTVVEANIRYPTDSSLLGDGVRVLSRLVGRARAVIGEGEAVARGLFRDRTRSAKRLARRIADSARRRGEGIEDVRRELYGRLLGIAGASLRQAERVRKMLSDSRAGLARKLEHFEGLFGRAPDLVAADRGVHSARNERICKDAGVRRVVLPKPGKKDEARRGYECQGWFRRGMRYRAGVEGRISVMKRRGYLSTCRDKGESGFGRWVGWGVLTSNLSTIARTVAAR